MRITLLASEDLASSFAINLLLPKLSAHQVTVFLSSKVGGGGGKVEQLRALKRFEQGLLNELPFPTVSMLDDINTPRGFAQLESSAPELILSIRYGLILKEPIISLPPHGVINLHSGLLPDYRGVMATFWAMLNSERTIGTTLHYISDSSIDTGDAIANSSLTVSPGKSYLWHVLQLYIDGCELMAHTVEAIASGVKVPTLAQPAGGNYYTFPGEEEVAEFHERGYKLFDEAEIIEFIKERYS
jgi:methionyl-tRNA formyltransferase